MNVTTSVMFVVTSMEIQVGVRELKARLSHYLRRVKAGDTVTITDRGRVIARVNPVAFTDNEPIWKMVREGRVSWSGGKPTGARVRVKLKHGRLVSDAVLEDRQ